MSINLQLGGADLVLLMLVQDFFSCTGSDGKKQ